MAPTRLMISTEVRGRTTDDNSFTCNSSINGEALTRIVVFYRKSIDSLTLHHTGNMTPVTWGSDTGTKAEIILGPGDFVTSVNGFFGGAILTQLGFKTNKGIHFGPYGGEDADDVNDRFDWNAGVGAPEDLAKRMGLLYFSGRACGYIYQLRATFALYPLAEEPVTLVKFEKQVSPEPAAHGIYLSSFARNIMSPLVALHVGPDAVLFHTYEATLCLVPFFRAALQGQFREAAEKKITMPEEKPEIIAALIEYLSTGTYTYTYTDDAATDPSGAPNPDLGQGCFHVGVYAIAFTYDWPPLVSDALSNFLSVLPYLDGMDIVRLWQAAYEKGLTIPLCAEGGRLAEFEKVLPKLLKRLYKTDGEEMDNMVVEFPALASDFMRFLVASCED